MRLVKGINHIAVITANLERFIEFYTSVFGLEVVFREDAGAFRHAILRAGDDSWVHPAEVADNSHGTALPKMFARGHLDHLALTAASQAAFDAIRSRLAEYSACAGEVEDLGAFHSIWFEDPDGMRGELVVIVDPALNGIHAPRPLRTGAAPPKSVTIA